MTQHRLVFVVLVASTSLVACDGKKTSPPGVTQGGAKTATEFCNSLVQAIVDVQTRCFGGGESVWKDLYARAIDCGRLTSDVSSGVLSYDPAKGAACLDQIANHDCDLYGTVPPCMSAVAGHVPTGGACSTAEQVLFTVCAPGNHCSSKGMSCGGTCQAYAQVGAPCGYTSENGSVDCVEGASCQLNTDVCVADAGEGQPCEGPQDGDCVDGLYCEGGTTSTAGVCRKRKTSGSCASGGECGGNYVCAGSPGSKTCRKAKLVGEACTPGMGECYPYVIWCGSDGQCTNARAQEGEACGFINTTTTGDYVQCASGLGCVTGTGSGGGTCQKGKPAGSPCSSGSECTGGTINYCDSTTKLCVACS
jgi:hypothetical protein